MACCAVLAVALGGLRALWFRVFPARRPAEPGFAPPARRSADGTAPSIRRPAPPGRRSPVAGSLLLGVAWGAAGYALVVAVVCTTPLVQVAQGPWFWRDAALVTLATVALASGLASRNGVSRPALLLGAGTTWTELGLVDMHVLGLFDFRVAALPLDLAFHGSGLLLVALGARHLANATPQPRASHP